MRRVELTSGPDIVHMTPPILSFRFCRTAALLAMILLTLATNVTAVQAESPTADTNATAITNRHQQFLTRYCIDCHDSGAAENDVVLSDEFIDWSQPESLAKWELVQSLIDRQIMPPADATQPDKDERKRMTSWLDEQILQHSTVGGTPLRRLSSREYQNTIASIFDLATFKLPANFPPDISAHGFDNQGADLVLAGSHLEAMADTATSIADLFFLPSTAPPASREVIALPDDLTISYSSACLIDGAMRLASSGGNLRRHATWPSRFAAPATGKYLIEITATASENASLPAQLEASAMTDVSSKSRVLQQLQFGSPEAQTHTFEARLEKGETITLRYTNGAIDYENKPAYRDLLTKLFDDEPRLAAAWHAVGQPARGGSGWARVIEQLKDPNLNAAPFIEQKSKREAVVKGMVKDSVKSGETLVYRYFEKGPFLGINQLKINGPIETYADKDETLRLQRRHNLTAGLSDQSAAPEIQAFLTQFLSRTFRRPATDREVTAYTALIQQERKRTKSIDRGLHLAIRSALLSPAFLYRNIGPGELTDNELASRLSYFLSSKPPDARLQKLANGGTLKSSKVLASQATRLSSSNTFAVDFTRQWLGLDALAHLMPDRRLTSNFKAEHKKSMMSEVRLTFQHVLNNNLPVHDLVTPDFLFTDEHLGWQLYGLPEYRPAEKGKPNKIAKGMKKLSIERDSRRGGLLSMPAVLMATANGVDTQPVLRGVWVLENILGSPTPDPPNAVPALTPDTRGTTNPKQRLAAHMASESCAACHKFIDPLGFVLESFDPIGRWRDHYPRYEEKNGKTTTQDGPEIDSSGTLPDGEALKDIQDLKRWLKNNPEPFVRCICEKLLTYATGREMNYRERKIIADIVRSQAKNQYRFRDLLIALVQSDIFRTK